MDMWYVLEAPKGSATSSQAAAEKRLKKQQQAGQAKDGGEDEEVSTCNAQFRGGCFVHNLHLS